MKPFDSVVIGSARDTFAEAQAMRAALESYLLNVHLYWFRQRRNLMDFLAGQVAGAEYVVLNCHGDPRVADDPTTTEIVVHGLPEANGQQGPWDVRLSPDAIRERVRLPGRTVITCGCWTGIEPIARAFLDSGCRAYIGPAAPVDQDAGPLFVSAFFYFLLRPSVDPSVSMTEERATELAASIDKLSREGTHLFRYCSADTLTP